MTTGDFTFSRLRLAELAESGRSGDLASQQYLLAYVDTCKRSLTAAARAIDVLLQDGARFTRDTPEHVWLAGARLRFFAAALEEGAQLFRDERAQAQVFRDAATALAHQVAQAESQLERAAQWFSLAPVAAYA